MAESLAFMYHDRRRATVLVRVRLLDTIYVPMPARKQDVSIKLVSDAHQADIFFNLLFYPHQIYHRLP